MIFVALDGENWWLLLLSQCTSATSLDNLLPNILGNLAAHRLAWPRTTSQLVIKTLLIDCKINIL